MKPSASDFLQRILENRVFFPAHIRLRHLHHAFTLASAAKGIVFDLYLHRFKRSARPLDPDSLLNGKTRREIVDLCGDTENFLKHAKDDPERILECNPLMTGFILTMTIRAYVELYGLRKRDHLIHAFPIYFGCHYPTLFGDNAVSSLKKRHPFDRIKKQSKDAFLRDWMKPE